MHPDEDGFGATISDLRRKGERRHLNGNYKGAYEAFRKAARTRPDDRELWDEYAKAYSNLQQQIEDRQAIAPPGYNSISRDLTSSVSTEDTFAAEETRNISDVGSQSINWSQAASQVHVGSPKAAIHSGSALQAVHEEQAMGARTFEVRGDADNGTRVVPSATYLEKEAVWTKNKFQLGAYVMWLITALTVCIHFISGWVEERDTDPLEPTLTLAVLISALALLWKFGLSFSSGLHNTSKALSAFALAVITVGHWAAFWTEVQETWSNSTSTNSTAAIVFS